MNKKKKEAGLGPIDLQLSPEAACSTISEFAGRGFIASRAAYEVGGVRITITAEGDDPKRVAAEMTRLLAVVSPPGSA